MFEILIYTVGALCLLGVASCYFAYKDVFHPGMILLPMFFFMYAMMPYSLSKSGVLWTFVTEAQVIWVHSIVIGTLIMLIGGLHHGSMARVKLPRRPIYYDRKTLYKGAYIIGAMGFLAWGYTVQSSGGITEVFGKAKGIGWSDFGYIREAAYLIIVALLLLMSPEGFQPKNKLWLATVAVLSAPYLLQGLLGAQRGPTFLIVVTLGMSFYLARGIRPSLATMAAGGAGLGFLLVFLVVNRDAIYIGSNRQLSADVGDIMEATEANEYIFGTGCMVAASAENRFFWGRRYIAQVLVRPIPRQIWPNKYQDFGVPELLRNAGVAGEGLAGVMGWKQVQGAAAGMVADLWVEFSFLIFPTVWIIGYWYASRWKRAVVLGAGAITQYMILALLSIYMVSQSGEAVIFRFVILTAPTIYVWKKAARSRPVAVAA